MKGDRLPDPRLLSRAIHGFKWNYLGNLGRVASQFVSAIVLARLLSPSEFGLVSLAWIFVNVAKLVADFGMGASLVQRRSFDSRALHTAFSAQIIVGTTIYLLFFLGRNEIADYLGSPQLGPVLAALGLTFPMLAVTQVFSSVLVRNLNFKELQIANTSSYLLAYFGFAIPAAYLGLGVWSLIGAQLLQAALNLALVIKYSRIDVKFKFSDWDPTVFKFGSKVLLANVTSWIILNFDAILIAKIFGTYSLGLYNRAQNLLLIPVNAAMSGLQPVVFSGFAKSNGKGEIERSFLNVSIVVALLSVPLLLTAASISRTIILGFYGEKWISAQPLFAGLCIAMIFHVLLCMVGPTLMAIDSVKKEVYAQLSLILLVGIALYMWRANLTLDLLPWCIAVIYGVRLLLLIIFLRSRLPIDLPKYMAIIFGTVAVSLPMVAITKITESSLSASVLPAWAMLLVCMLVALVAYPACVLVGARFLLPDDIKNIIRTGDKFPLFFRKIIK
ncbi:MAG: lipopolysaccharide biosynthesis protein [Gammaproteobacteria bacterium]